MNRFKKVFSISVPDTHAGKEQKRQPYEPAYLRPRKIVAICDGDKDSILKYNTILSYYDKSGNTDDQ